MRFLTTLFLSVFLQANAFAAKANFEKIPLIGDLTVHKTQLENGLEVLIVPNSRALDTTVVHLVKAGSIHENDKTSGIAHLFEHMMFRPVNKGDKPFWDEIKPLNGTANANTRFATTLYHTSVPDQYLENLLKIEANRFINTKITDDLVKVEAQAVLSELSSKKDSSPIANLWFRIYELGYANTPFGWHIMGYLETIKNVTAKDCNEFFKNYYQPKNVGLVISGRVDPESTIKLVEKYYSSWKNTGKPVPPTISPENKFVTGNATISFPETTKFIGFRTPVYNSENLFPLMVGQYILLDSGYSLVERHFKLKNKSVSRIGGMNSNYDQGMMKAYVEFLEPTSHDSILKDIEMMKQSFQKIDDEEFNAYLKELQLDISRSIEKNIGLANQVSLFWGKHDNLKALSDLLNGNISVTKKEIEKFYDKYLVKDNTIIISGPDTKGK